MMTGYLNEINELIRTEEEFIHVAEETGFSAKMVETSEQIVKHAKRIKGVLENGNL